MTTDLLASPFLPPEPSATAEVSSRMAWYAAVARWAPSKHNTQPWRFVVRGASLEVWADSGRMLPESDPNRRELIMSCGTAAQLACVAARAHGYLPHVTLLPQGSNGCLARMVEVGPWQTTDGDRALLAAVPRRRTDRGPLDDEGLPGSLPFLLQSEATLYGAALRLVSTPGDRSTLAGLVERADRLLIQRGHVDQELEHWLREPGDPRPDGVPTDHSRGAAASYRAEFVQRDFSSRGSKPAQDRFGRDHPLVGILCTPHDRVDDWLVAGLALAAVLLQATAAGANTSYLNQPVEEPAIRVQLREQQARRLGILCRAERAGAVRGARVASGGRGQACRSVRHERHQQRQRAEALR